MPVIGRRDDDSVNRLVGENRTEIAVIPGRAPGALDGSSHPALVGVTDADDLDSGRRRDGPHQLMGAAAHPDDPDLESVVGGDRLFILALRGRRPSDERRRGGSDEALLHELTSIDAWLHDSPRVGGPPRGGSCGEYVSAGGPVKRRGSRPADAPVDAVDAVLR